LLLPRRILYAAVLGYAPIYGPASDFNASTVGEALKLHHQPGAGHAAGPFLESIMPKQKEKSIKFVRGLQGPAR